MLMMIIMMMCRAENHDVVIAINTVILSMSNFLANSVILHQSHDD